VASSESTETSVDRVTTFDDGVPTKGSRIRPHDVQSTLS